MDYDFAPLGTEGFERLGQALVVAELGSNVKPTGTGRDAGRDLHFRGPVALTGEHGPWNGYGVVQIKHRGRDIDTGQNSTWVKRQIDGELALWRWSKNVPPKRREKPEYYLFVTSATLSPEGQDACTAYLQAQAERLGIREAVLWSRAEVSRLLDAKDGIRRTYLHLILPGDVVAAMQSTYGEQDVDLARQLSVSAAVELSDRQWARLGDSGLESEERLRLSTVAVDLPCTSPDFMEIEGEAENPEPILRRAIELGDADLRSSSRSEYRGIVLKGGPGQGKTTIAQLLCQLYRAAFVADSSALMPTQRKLIEQMADTAARLGLATPQRRRWPVYVDLSKFGDYLMQEGSRSLMGYIASSARVHGESLRPNQLQRWRGAWPWAVVLDGLDEVAHPRVRQSVATSVNEFLTDCNVNDADVLLFATTRPQGYHGEFDGFELAPYELSPLSPHEALAYGELLASYRYEDDTIARERVIQRLHDAVSGSFTQRLMTTPLQVTIMSTLLERVSRVPDSRHALFDAYYKAIYSREQVRASALGEILTRYQPVVDYLHEQVALYLQSEAEVAGSAEPLVQDEALVPLILTRLERDGHSDTDAKNLAAEIVRAVRTRVVLLVGIRDDLVGYEVRSLQEYFAARAISTGREDDIVRRITALVPSSHWRNTLLFAVGRLQSHSNPQLIDSIVMRCAEADNASSLAIEIGPGERLALDLLDDGFAAHVPRVRKVLLRQAMQSLRHWPDRRIVQLARAMEVAIEDDREGLKLVQSTLEQHLSSGHPQARLSAMSVLGPWMTSKGATGTLASYLLGQRRDLVREVAADERTVVGERLRVLVRTSGLTPGQLDAVQSLLTSFDQLEYRRGVSTPDLVNIARRGVRADIGGVASLLTDERVVERFIEVINRLDVREEELALIVREYLIAGLEQRAIPQEEIMERETALLLSS